MNVAGYCGRRRRQKGLFARNIPCLRKVAVKPFGLALASLVSSAKFASSHFVHESNFANPLLGFSTCSQYKINGPQKGSIYFRAGKGFDSSSVTASRLTPHPNGLIAYAIIPKFALRTSSMIEFCRTLFSGSRPFFYHIKKEKPPHRWFLFFRAGKGSRTLDIDLGKVALYQLSYSRVGSVNLVKLRGL